MTAGVTSQVLLGRAGGYVANAVDFDGTNDYLTRGAGLTGASDHSQGIFSAWLRLDGSDATLMRLIRAADGNAVLILRDSGNKFVFHLSNTAATSTLAFKTVNSYTSGSAWRHVLASWDLNFGAGSKLSHLYIDGTSDITVTTDSGSAANVDYTQTDWGFMASHAGASLWNGCVSEFYFAPGQFLDLSDSSNRSKFRTAGGKPADLGSDGSTPTGTSPLVYLKGNAAGFATNSGTGGNLTLTGTLDTASTSPSD